MRIGDLAEAVGASVRTIRLYHATGALPEPPRNRSGHRDYGIEHLAAAARIRWFTRAGASIRQAGAVAAGELEPEPFVAETLERLDAEARRIERQRALLRNMRENLRLGGRPSPLPARLERALHGLEAQLPPAERARLRAEREQLELVAFTGQAPAAFFERLAEIYEDAPSAAAVLQLLRRYEALAGTAPDPRRIERLVEQALAVPGLAAALALAPEVPTEETMAARAAELVPDQAQRALLLRLLARLRERG